MPSCPHATHQSLKQIESSTVESISFCRDSCLRTFFFCQKCGEANRPLARFCRRCGDPIDYAGAEILLERSTAFSVQPIRGESNSLARHALNQVHSLESRLGSLFVIADSAILVFDTHSLHEPLRSIRLPGRAIRGMSVKSSSDDVQLLVTTSDSVYQLSLLEDTTETELYAVSERSRLIYNHAFYCGDNVYFLEYDEKDRTSNLIRLPDQSSVSFKGLCRQPLIMLNDQVFFCTENEIFRYNTKEQILNSQKSPEHLNRFADPAYSEELECVYFVGENNFWRLNLNNSETSPLPLKTLAAGDPRIAATGDKLFVARSTGLVILNPFGEVQWDSNKNFISASSDLRAPRIFPNEFIFTSLGRFGGSDVRIHSRNNPDRFELVSYEKRLACAPLLSLGRLISVVGEESAIELKVS